MKLTKREAQVIERIEQLKKTDLLRCFCSEPGCIEETQVIGGFCNDHWINPNDKGCQTDPEPDQVPDCEACKQRERPKTSGKQPTKSLPKPKQKKRKLSAANCCSQCDEPFTKKCSFCAEKVCLKCDEGCIMGCEQK